MPGILCAVSHVIFVKNLVWQVYIARLQNCPEMPVIKSQEHILLHCWLGVIWSQAEIIGLFLSE